VKMMCTQWRNRVALVVQIHLQQNRLDLASKEATNARKWAQDSLLVNIAESWVGMREVRNILNRVCINCLRMENRVATNTKRHTMFLKSLHRLHPLSLPITSSRKHWLNYT